MSLCRRLYLIAHLHVKLDASVTGPDPLYLAILGHAQIGRLRSDFVGKPPIARNGFSGLSATSWFGARPLAIHLSSAAK